MCATSNVIWIECRQTDFASEIHRQTESREGPQLKYSISGAFSSALWPRQGYVLLKSSPWLGAREHRGQVLAARHDAHPRHGADTRDLARARVAVRGEVQRHGEQPRVRGASEQRARTVIDETQLGLSRRQVRYGRPAVMRPKRLIGRGWPALGGGLRRALALKGAPGQPPESGRRLSQLAFDRELGLGPRTTERRQRVGLR